MSGNDDGEASKRKAQLERIAEALDVPVSMFMILPDQSARTGEDPQDQLLRLLSSLPDPLDRRRLVAIAEIFVRYTRGLG